MGLVLGFFRAQGIGFMVCVQSLGFRVQGIEVRV